MKNVIIIFAVLLCTVSGFSQVLDYQVKGKYTRGVSQEKLELARSMSDLRAGYPSSWINEYVSTEIAVKKDGRISIARGSNETLSAEQQNLLQTAEVGSDIEVNVGYIYQNPVTGFPDIRKMHFVETVVPEVEAQFPGGYEDLRTYVDKNAIDKIADRLSDDKMPFVLITFTVTEKGEISNAQIVQSSKDPEVDRVLLKAINRMPSWKPAENAVGIKIRQEFEFSLGSNDGC